jgi:hypothetical protein
MFILLPILAGGCATQPKFLSGPKRMNPAPLIEEYLVENPHPAVGDLQSIDMLNKLMSQPYGFTLMKDDVYTGAWLVKGSVGSAVVYGSAKRIQPGEGQWAVTELRIDFLDLNPSAKPRLQLERVYPESTQ